MTQVVTAIRAELRALVNLEKAVFFPRFFKSGPGEYAEGDQFLGVTVPHMRSVAKRHAVQATLADLDILLTSPWHEERLTALLIAVQRYAKADAPNKKAIYQFYLDHTRWINNWDLVDISSEYIVGPYLENKPEQLSVLQRLAASDSLWERRIAMLATFHYIKKGRPETALLIAEQLLHDNHDLLHKAVGWMLREIGKRVDQSILLQFLDQHAATMPRTTLRYAIEHLPPDRRQHYMKLKRQ